MHAPVPSERAITTVGVVVAALSVLTLGFLLYGVTHLSGDNTRQDGQIDTLAQTTQAQSSALKEANDKLIALGEQPVTTPPVPTTVKPQNGANGKNGSNATSAQIQAAVAVQCGVTNCRGPIGRTGASGAPGAASTIPGPTGQTVNGKDGKDGADSTVPGPQGDKGDPGTQGNPGAPAFPFTWSYVVPGTLGDTTYICTVTDPNVMGTCMAG